MALVTTAATALAGVVFGLAIAAPPGPMNAIIAEESVLRGWHAGFRAGLGAMTADACFLLLALYGAVSFVGRYPAVRAAMVGIGGLLMCYFAYGAVRGANASLAADSVRREGTVAAERKEAVAPADDRAGDERRGTDADGNTGFAKAFVLAITNPYQIVFWLTVGVGLLEPGRLDVLSSLPYVGDALAGSVVVATGTPLLLLGFFAGIALWVTCFPATLVAVGRRVDAFAPAVAYVSGAVLAGFGVLFLTDALTTLA